MSVTRNSCLMLITIVALLKVAEGMRPSATNSREPEPTLTH